MYNHFEVLLKLLEFGDLIFGPEELVGHVDHANILHATNPELWTKDGIILLPWKSTREKFLIEFNACL